MSEEWSNNLVLYIYDTDGSPIGMQYRNTSYAEGVFDTYWYEKNLQGDIVAVYNQTGAKLISYTYDAWGNCTVSYPNNGSSSTAIYNPFRYRGYYLDTETGFYYLNSRYYDPAIGRFITPDKLSTVNITPLDLTDKNLYAYCDNNPLTRTDDGGEFWHIIAGGVVGGLIGAATKMFCNVIENKENIWEGVGMAAVTGAASVALAATGVGLVGQMVGGATIAMAGNAAQQGIDIANGKKDTFDVQEMIFDGAVGAVCGLVGGPGASQGNSKTAIDLGKNLTKQIFKTGEVRKSFAHYGANMVNGAGKSIYKELRKAFIKSGLTGLGINAAKSVAIRRFA